MRSKSLPVVVDHPEPVAVELEDGTVLHVTGGPPPATRADCPVERPCRYVRCVHNLSFIDGRDRSGRWRGRIPATLDLDVLRGERPSCTLDLIDTHKRMSSARIGSALGTSTRMVEMILRRALEKIRDSGVGIEPLLEVLRADDEGAPSPLADAAARHAPGVVGVNGARIPVPDDDQAKAARHRKERREERRAARRHQGRP